MCSQGVPGTVQCGTSIPGYLDTYQGGMLARDALAGKGATVLLPDWWFLGATPVEWIGLCSVVEVTQVGTCPATCPATVLVHTQLRCRDTWGSTTALGARMAQAALPCP